MEEVVFSSMNKLLIKKKNNVYPPNHFVRILQSLRISCFENQLLNKINCTEEGEKRKVFQSSKRIKRRTKILFSVPNLYTNIEN